MRKNLFLAQDEELYELHGGSSPTATRSAMLKWDVELGLKVTPAPAELKLFLNEIESGTATTSNDVEKITLLCDASFGGHPGGGDYRWYGLTRDPNKFEATLWFAHRDLEVGEEFLPRRLAWCRWSAAVEDQQAAIFLLSEALVEELRVYQSPPEGVSVVVPGIITQETLHGLVFSAVSECNFRDLI